MKLGRDMSGRVVTQQTRSFEPSPEQTAEAAEFLARYLPGAFGPELVSKTCVYDLTPDRNFVLDTVPGHPHISLFIGAGHAAKFAALLGHILADLAIDGETGYEIESFTLERPAIRDPGFPTDFRFARAAQEQNADPWAVGAPENPATEQ
ncbi:MAG: Sarcosine oxidase [Actinomycetia bacterium]|nr:Sarcosine oxidase [Actinomycetes bacterium]